MRRAFLLLIRIYQLTFSPIIKVLGGGCRFYPSCSEYSSQAFKKHHPLKAGCLTVWRLLRCNPFNSGGFDPVR